METAKTDLEIYDELNIRQTPKITMQLKPDEKVYFSGKVNKFNRMEWKQERIFVITNMAIYNIKKHKIQRRMAIRDIAGITKSTDKKCFEFVVHHEWEYDYRLVTDERKRDEIFLILKHCYFNVFSKNLPVYGVAYSHLKDFTTGKDDAKDKISRIPPKGNLLKDENLFRDKWNKISKPLPGKKSSHEGDVSVPEEEKEVDFPDSSDSYSEVRRATMIFNEKDKKIVSLEDFERLKGTYFKAIYEYYV
jgi:hypothetical protein